ncbi:MAG: exodeoxyribonuclease V subunit beta [Limnohabitans sp.]
MSRETVTPEGPARLKPLTLPLRGSQLIEASAGTGKTFTIAMLYVRLVLGHGGEVAAHGRALTPPEILVVTFTEAATQELRDRIRARLAQAASYFRVSPQDVVPPQQPDLLHDLRAGYAPGDWAACARKLDLAAQWMDEAAVSTIHGWCNRMLHEHAFDSLSLFTQTLETDPSELRAEVVRDYWRQFYYPLSQPELEQVTAFWNHPAELEKALRHVLDLAEKLPAQAPPSVILQQCHDDRRAQLQALKQAWPQWVDEFEHLLRLANEQHHFDRRKLGPANYTRWLNTIREWATTPTEQLSLGDAAWLRLTPQGMAEAWTHGSPPQHPLLDELAGVRIAQRHLPQPKAGLLGHAARWIAAELKTTQQRRAQLGFDDLLSNLDSALHGENGASLAQVIRQQFPVALIDEFQDTDPLQYRIFERIYQPERNDQDSTLILIGDPKQAIYAFRGADIHTYLKARAAVGPRLHTLGTNFRSTQALVEATNHCFQRVELEPDSMGAFLFRRNGSNPVPFIPVSAQGLPASFVVEGNTPAPLCLHVLPPQGKLSKEAYIHQMAEISATQLVGWLQLGQQGSAGFVEPGLPLVPVKPADIAILVNNRQEAQSMRQALARRGVRSVYLSDKDTVFDTPQATEIYRWLLACAEPDNERWVRAALCTPTLGLDFATLDALHTDELAWESRLEQFKGYREIWRQQGVLPMLRRILIDFECAARLLHLQVDAWGQSGERILTDLLHLAELLQQASATLEGEQALIRFLAEHMAQPQGGSDDKKLRLESDANLVQVVTIHKSKGLEYPLVMLPFICATRPSKIDDVPLTWHDDAGDLQVSLAGDEAIRARADGERLGEDVRKLYVALTRARHLTWLGLAHLETHAHSALAYLLGLQHATPDSLVPAVYEAVRGHPHVQVVDAPVVNDHRFDDPALARVPGLACRPQRAARERWWISSYSNLPMGGHPSPPRPVPDDTAQTANWLESQLEQPVAEDWPTAPLTAPPNALPTALPTATSVHPMHRFPKGAHPGTFLHALMEWCANTGFETVLQTPDTLRQQITQRCAAMGWDSWGEPLFDWVQTLLTTPLPAGSTSIRLDTVITARAEMEFWIETRQLNLQALDQAVTRHTLEGRPRPALACETLHGMLKGFMDLVLEHEGRYYVADYKSNWLGAHDGAYTAASIEASIRAHRYDLQYVLYLFALHRLLGSRLPDYDYDQHVGGALYLYVRGITAPTAGVHFDRPPKALMLELDRLFAGHSGGVS